MIVFTAGIVRKTNVDPNAKDGRIVEVNCRARGTQHDVSVFFRLQKPGKVRMTTAGVVCL